MEKAVTTDEFRIKSLKAAITAKKWYVVPFSGTTTPTPELTLATLWTTYTEVIDYEAATRPEWLPDDTSDPFMFGTVAPDDETGPIPPSAALFNFKNAPANTKVNGFAVVSVAAKGDKSGEVMTVWLLKAPIDAIGIVPVYHTMDISECGAAPARRF